MDTRVPARAVPASASPWVAALLRGPVRHGPVVGRGPYARYLILDGECIAVLTSGAVAVPVGLRTRLNRLPAHGESVRVGHGIAAFGDTSVAVTRVVDVRVPRLRRADPDALEGLRRAVDRCPAVHDVAAELDPVALRSLAAADPGAVLGLLGRGSGLTPAGDDVLAGFLVAAHALDTPPRSLAAAVAAAVADAVRLLQTDRTTVISASLLRRACAGEAVPQVRELLQDAAAGRSIGVPLAGLLAVGHSSGAALALGITLALGVLGTAR